jgi:hypothetical protein
MMKAYGSHPHCAGGVRFMIKTAKSQAQTTGGREIIVFDESVRFVVFGLVTALLRDFG